MADADSNSSRIISRYSLFSLYLPFTGAPFDTYVPAFLAPQFSQALTAGNMQVIGSLIAPEHVRGRFFGIWRLMGEAGSAASPIVFAFIAARVSYAASFAVLSLSALCAAIVLATQVTKALKKGAGSGAESLAPVPVTHGSTA